jgi:hypothetical protein
MTNQESGERMNQQYLTGDPQPRVPTPEINPGQHPNEYQPTPQPNANPPEAPMEVPPVHE